MTWYSFCVAQASNLKRTFPDFVLALAGTLLSFLTQLLLALWLSTKSD